jgi:hypothetical protein
MNKTSAFAALAFAFTGPAFAQHCSTVRLDLQGGPLENIPIIEQGSLNVCRFIAATDLISAALSYQSKRTKDLSWVSTYADAASGDGYQNVKGMIDRARGNGVCTTDAILGALRSSATTCREVAEVKNTFGLTLTSNPQQTCELLPPDDPRGGMELARTNHLLADALGAKAPSYRAVSEAVTSVCKNNRIDASKLSDVRYVFGHQLPVAARSVAFRQHIDEVLTEPKPMPVGITYCADVLDKRDATGVDPVDGKHSSKICTDTGLHSSIIIGRRVRGSQCQYLVRNSWGRACKRYDTANQCEEGKIWVESADLIRNIIYTFSIKAVE